MNQISLDKKGKESARTMNASGRSVQNCSVNKALNSPEPC